MRRLIIGKFPIVGKCPTAGKCLSIVKCPIVGKCPSIGKCPIIGKSWRRGSNFAFEERQDACFRFANIQPSHFLSEIGQMTVELAFLIPVVIVCALIIINLGFYTSACAQFDRAAADVVLSRGSAPSGEQSSTQVKAEIETALQETMGDAVKVDVALEHVDATKTNTLFTLNPTRIKVICTMHYKPIPSTFSISGVELNPPIELTHTKTMVIDMGTSGLGVDT